MCTRTRTHTPTHQTVRIKQGDDILNKNQWYPKPSSWIWAPFEVIHSLLANVSFSPSWFYRYRFYGLAICLMIVGVLLRRTMWEKKFPLCFVQCPMFQKWEVHVGSLWHSRQGSNFGTRVKAPIQVVMCPSASTICFIKEQQWKKIFANHLTKPS